MLREKFDYILQLKPIHGTYSAARSLQLNSSDPTISEKLTQINIPNELTGEGIVITGFSSNALPIFYNNDEFLKDIKLSNYDSDFGIIQDAFFFESSSQLVLQAGAICNENNIVSNTLHYLKIKEVLTDNSSVDAFANYTDFARRKIIAISGTKGTMLIGFPTTVPRLNIGYDTKQVYNTLSKSIQAKGFITLFKTEVFDYLKTTIEDDRFKNLIENLKIILENTERNFEVYMSNFSFAALRDKLTEERVKYFNVTKDILSKVYTQITSIPIAISAAAFATYKVDSRLTLSLIFCGFFVYAFFVFRILVILRNEIGIVNRDYGIEKARIENESKLDSASIKNELGNIGRRINDVKNIINTFMGMFVVLSLLFVLFISYQFIFINNPLQSLPTIIYFPLNLSFGWKIF